MVPSMGTKWGVCLSLSLSKLNLKQQQKIVDGTKNKLMAQKKDNGTQMCQCVTFEDRRVIALPPGRDTLLFKW